MSNLSLFGFLLLLYEAFGEYCSDDTYCDTPSKCCETKRGCCFDSMMHGRHFRLHEWNMWYFWFLIIFMMMSCFGGCGYYRRRRLAMLSRSPVSSAAHTSSVTLSHHGGSGQRAQERRARRFNYFAYNGPGNMGIFPMPQYIQEPSVTSLPPAYSEVVNQPSLYPVNDKTGLPPYPGLDKPENGQVLPVAAGGASVWPIEDSRLPPPYSESVHNTGSEQQPPVQQPVDSHEPSLSGCTPQPLSSTPNSDSVVRATPGDGSNQEGLSVVVAPGSSNNSRTRLGLP
ncbi:vesicular, overexpressed in cancer, prosurvival protein 1-like [Plakobranchus ocellatus]|uniref:WW domain binding protein VOPP1 n=1 Tax=Plakobranchus ocellatus TaxID=259542 RepID=A0AAV4AE55_9GAST|nr:vesicular, overexpressed in cancer, prosurvival protein 1-like [Plakobranchus ocellatus]